MNNFKKFVEASLTKQNPNTQSMPNQPQSATPPASGLMKQDFTSLSMSDRMAQGKNIGEPYIIQQLKNYGINIVPSTSYHADAILKIDGYLNGDQSEPVQLKIRRSGKGGRNDIAYELIRNHNSSNYLTNQLADPHQQGRDYKGQVKHYFVLNQAETEIYYATADSLFEAIIEAIRELNMSDMAGKLLRPFTASNGVDLRPTTDRDRNSFTPSKVMAFIPVDAVVEKKYPLT